MKKMFKIFALLLAMCLMAGIVSGCGQKGILSKTKCSTYIVNEDGTEELLIYSITTISKDADTVTETYSPDGTLLYTLHNSEFVYTEACTDEMQKELDSALGIMSLIGTNSDDLVHEVLKDDGVNKEEIFSSKSGAYPTLRQVYERIK